jgi:hypothetical protein
MTVEMATMSHTLSHSAQRSKSRPSDSLWLWGHCPAIQNDSWAVHGRRKPPVTEMIRKLPRG